MAIQSFSTGVYDQCHTFRPPLIPENQLLWLCCQGMIAPSAKEQIGRQHQLRIYSQPVAQAVALGDRLQGLLKENILGLSSSMLMPQSGQAKFWLNRMSSPLSTRFTCARLSARFRAVSW